MKPHQEPNKPEPIPEEDEYESPEDKWLREAWDDLARERECMEWRDP